MNMRRRATVAVAAVIAITMPSAQASANGPGYLDATAVETTVAVEASEPATSTGGPQAPTVEHCITAPVTVVQIADGVLSTLGGTGTYYGYDDQQLAQATGWTQCDKIDGTGAIQYLNGQPADPTPLLVASAESRLDLAAPEIATSPPRGSVQLVSVPVWFWAADTAPAATTASIPGLSATLTAVPGTLHVAISGGTGRAAGDNTTIDCPDAGTPYRPAEHQADDTSTCSHAFDGNDTFTVQATLGWQLTWTATNGQAGALPPIQRTTTFTLTVEEAQAVTD